MFRRALISLSAASLLSGCTLGPDYFRPELIIPEVFRNAPAAPTPMSATDSQVAQRWWTQFGDPVLNDLIQDALQRNQDLRQATARIDEYRAIQVATSGPLYPQVSLPTTATRSQTGSGAVTETYQSGLSVSWELDFWGRIRRLGEAARADLLSQDYARQAIILSLVSGVAASYVQLRELDARLEVARNTLAARQEASRLAGLRYDVGMISEMELRQATSELQTTVLSVQQLEQAVLQKENELNLLLGRLPGPVPRGKALGELVRPEIPAGLPSSLLDRRPDIQQAEQALVAANARIGAAKASLFPTISLTGSFGGASTQLSNLFSGPARLWTFVPGVSLPIFSGGSLLAQLTASEARREQALGAYQKAIQSAFRDTEDALVAVSKTTEQKATQTKLVEEVRRYAYLARLRYESGVASHLDVLDSQRNLFTAEQVLTQAQSASLVAVVSLYKALGGDWGVTVPANPNSSNPPSDSR